MSNFYQIFEYYENKNIKTIDFYENSNLYKSIKYFENGATKEVLYYSDGDICLANRYYQSGKLLYKYYPNYQKIIFCDKKLGFRFNNFQKFIIFFNFFEKDIENNISIDIKEINKWTKICLYR